MSFREKCAWICFFTTIAIYVPYFMRVFRLFESGELRLGAVLAAFIVAEIAQTLLTAGAQIVVGVVSGREPLDERDRVIESRSFKSSYIVLASLCMVVTFCVLVFSVSEPRSTGGSRESAVLVSQILLFCVVAAEAARYLTRAVSYRLAA
jgi:hypothetical protein